MVHLSFKNLLIASLFYIHCEMQIFYEIMSRGHVVENGMVSGLRLSVIAFEFGPDVKGFFTDQDNSTMSFGLL